jgi:hypothetical protein
LYSGFNNNKVRPLKNKTIVLTRTIEQSKESAAIFSELGADVIVFPTLEIVPPNNWDRFDELILSDKKLILLFLHLLMQLQCLLKDAVN